LSSKFVWELCGGDDASVDDVIDDLVIGVSIEINSFQDGTIGVDST
jgi:hypothetical protein